MRGSVPLAVYGQGCLYRNRAIHALEAAGRTWHIAYTSPNLPGILAAVSAGLGVSVLPDIAIGPEHRVLGAADGFPAIQNTELAHHIMIITSVAGENGGLALGIGHSNEMTALANDNPKTDLPLATGVSGNHYVQAYFAGGGVKALASARSNTIQVVQAGRYDTLTVLTSNLAAVAVGKQVTLTATVTTDISGSHDATGTVSFYSGSVDIANLLLRLRQRGIADQRTATAIEGVPRRLFVPPEAQSVAYHEMPLPIECGQTISAPEIVGLMTAALGVEPGDRVLEIGTGSGYQTAILAALARHVFTVERYRALLETAEARFHLFRAALQDAADHHAGARRDRRPAVGDDGGVGGVDVDAVVGQAQRVRSPAHDVLLESAHETSPEHAAELGGPVGGHLAGVRRVRHAADRPGEQGPEDRVQGSST